MKTSIFLALSLVLVISSCNHNSPSPSTPSTPTTTPTYSMTATETALVGDWIWDSTVVYAGGNPVQIYTPSGIISWGTVITNTIYAGSHMDLKSSLIVGTTMYNADFFGNSFGGSSGSWWIITSANGNKLQTIAAGYLPFQMGDGSGAYITTLNTTKLIVQGWTIGTIPNGNKAFYHK